MQLRRDDGYEISTDRTRLDLDAIHAFLRTAYWSPGVPRELMERAFANSICFGLYDAGGVQAGFARAVTDRAAFAWIGDVFVLDEHRGRGLGVWLIETLLSHQDLRTLRRISLATADAHGLYERFGFKRSTGERDMVLQRDPAELYEHGQVP